MSLHDLLTSNGFHPVSPGRASYVCPICQAGPGEYQSGDRRGPLRVYQATGEKNSGREMFKCHACDASGGAYALAVALDAVDHLDLATKRTADTTRGVLRGSRIDVAKAWSSIDADRFRWSTRLVEAVREWAAPDLAELVGRMTAVIVPADGPRGDAGKLTTWATRSGRSMLVALHDAEGRVRSCAGRAPIHADHVDRFRFLGNDRAGVSDGLTLTYGRIVDAVAVTGPIVLVEGARDWIAAHLWARRVGGVAVGARSCGELPTVARLLADALTNAGRPCSTVDVIVIPHLGDRQDVGVRYMNQAVELLRSRAVGRVRLVTVDTHRKDDRDVGDLADLFASSSTADAMFSRIDELVAQARTVVDTPIDLRDPAASSILAGIAERVVEQATADQDALVVWAPVEGSGKTRTCLDLLAAHARRGSTAVFVGRNHAQLTQATQELDRLGVDDVDVNHVEGRPRLCLQAQHLDRMGNREGARDLRDRLGNDRRGTICVGCSLRDVCPAMSAKPIAAGALSLVTHERARRGLKLPKRSPSLVIIDELCELVGQSAVSRDAVASVYLAEGPRSRAWQSQNPDVCEAVRKLVASIDAVARRRTGPHGAALSPATWVADLVEIGAVGPARVICEPTQADLFDGLTTDRELDPPPAPPARAVLHGHQWRLDYADRTAWSQIAQVAKHLARALDPADLPELVVDASAQWSLVTYQATRLAAGPTVILDATARENLPRLTALARRSGRRLVVIENDVRVESPGASVHLRTAAFATSRILVDGRPAPQAFALTRRVLLETASRLPTGGVVGLLTHKTLAVALGADEGDLADLRRWAGESLNLTLRLGYYGRDELGSNHFADVDALVCMGDPAVNMNAAASEARAVGADPLALWRSSTRSRARQAAARGRSARRGGGLALLLYVGREAPDVPGVAWSICDLDRGRSLSDERVEAVRVLTALADAHGALAPAVARRLPALDGHSDRRLREWSEAVGRSRSWRSWSVASGRARLTVWAPTREAAETVARMNAQAETVGRQGFGANAGVFQELVASSPRPEATGTAASTVSLMGISAEPLRHNGLRLHGPPRPLVEAVGAIVDLPAASSLRTRPGWTRPHEPATQESTA